MFPTSLKFLSISFFVLFFGLIFIITYKANNNGDIQPQWDNQRSHARMSLTFSIFIISRKILITAFTKNPVNPLRK